MPRSKELSERLRNTVVDTYKGGSGYKKISEQLGFHISTVRKIISKWKECKSTKNLPRMGRPPKISNRTGRKLVQEATKNPRVTSRDLQEQLAESGMHVHTLTICRHLNEDGLSARVPRKSLYWPKSTRKHVYALPKSMLIILMDFGQIFCGLMRPKLSSMVTWEVGTFGAHQKQLSKKRIWYQQSNTEVGAFYYGVALHHQVQANCFILKASWIPRFTKKFWKKVLVHQWGSWEWDALTGCSNRTTTLNIQVHQQCHGWRKRNTSFWNGPAKALIWTQ